MNASHFASVADFAGHQIATLAASGMWAGPDEGYEESSEGVDLSATLARIERHAGETASPQARHEAYVVEAVDALSLPNITGAEVVAVHKRVTKSGAKNRLPNGAALLALLIGLIVDQHVRTAAGLPLRFNSLYRSKEYNAAIGGASRSRHLFGDARDRLLIGGTIAQLARIDEEMEGKRLAVTTGQEVVLSRVASDSGIHYARTGGIVVAGGLGRYRTFVHRDGRGKRARW